jgi:hypothetical protein
MAAVDLIDAHASVRATFRLGHPDYRFIAAGYQPTVLNIGLPLSEVAGASPRRICQVGPSARVFGLKIRVFAESHRT